MPAWLLIMLITWVILASAMITLGVSQWTAVNPVTFYNSEKALPAEKLRSVKGWNRGHGLIWLVYGGVILLSCLPMLLSKREELIAAIAAAGAVLPIPFMIWRHHALIKKYAADDGRR